MGFFHARQVVILWEVQHGNFHPLGSHQIEHLAPAPRPNSLEGFIDGMSLASEPASLHSAHNDCRLGAVAHPCMLAE